MSTIAKSSKHHRCFSITKDGTRCKNRVNGHSQYCWVHKVHHKEITGGAENAFTRGIKHATNSAKRASMAFSNGTNLLIHTIKKPFHGWAKKEEMPSE